MVSINSFRRALFQTDTASFEERALWLFRRQAGSNPVYRAYLGHLGIDPKRIDCLEDIPFMPVAFFRDHRVVSNRFIEEAVFESSATTGQIPSRHYVRNLQYYYTVAEECFTRVYGPPKGRCFLGLLPSYLERPNASLVYMVRHLIRAGGHPDSGFFLDDYETLGCRLHQLMNNGEQAILFGVTFALLDFAAYFREELRGVTVIETGGMKGRRHEMTREEVHAGLREVWGPVHIHSEYGMTEMMSQAYAGDQGIFNAPPWVRVMVREIRDPFHYCESGRQGALNVIDLANIDTCAFLETQDVGMSFYEGGFAVQGRVDNSELRGCSLMLH